MYISLIRTMVFLGGNILMKVFAESRSRGKEFAKYKMSWSLMRLKMNQLVMWLRRKAGRLWGLFVMYIWCRPRCLNLVTTSWMSE